MGEFNWQKALDAELEQTFAELDADGYFERLDKKCGVMVDVSGSAQRSVEGDAEFAGADREAEDK